MLRRVNDEGVSQASDVAGRSGDLVIRTVAIERLLRAGGVDVVSEDAQVKVQELGIPADSITVISVDDIFD